MFNFGNYSNYSRYLNPSRSYGWTNKDENNGENHPCYTVGQTSDGKTVLSFINSNGDVSSSLTMSQEALEVLIEKLESCINK